MKSAAEAVEAVERLDRDLEALNAQWFEALDILLPFIANDTIDAMYAAMSPKLKRVILSDARTQFSAYDAIIAGRLERGQDPAGWIAVRQWVYRQPFDLDFSLPLPSQDEAKKLGRTATFLRMLPHFPTMSVEGVLATLPSSWRTKELPSVAAGMRPGIDVILATCRKSGQDPTPFVKLMEWEASLPLLPTTRRHA